MARLANGTTEARRTPSVHALIGRRLAPTEALARDASAVALTCLATARRLHSGGMLYAFGSGSASTDAQHVAVEFVHPVIVGKPALPALALTTDVPTLTATAAERHDGHSHDGHSHDGYTHDGYSHDGYTVVFAEQLRGLAGPGDVALGIADEGDCREIEAGLRTAAELGALTVAMVDARTPAGVAAAAEHVLIARTADPRVAKEIRVTAYHLLWELVHVLADAPPDEARTATVPGVGAGPDVEDPAVPV